jgi:hypothetical protein
MLLKHQVQGCSHLKPELGSRFEELSAATGCAPEELVCLFAGFLRQKPEGAPTWSERLLVFQDSCETNFGKPYRQINFSGRKP